MRRTIATWILLTVLTGCGGGTSIEIGPFAITHLELYPAGPSIHHLTMTLTCVGDVVAIISSLDLSVDGTERLNLLKHETFPPSSSMMVYRRNLVIPDEKPIHFEAIVDGVVFQSEDFMLSDFPASTSTQALEESLGKVEVARFLGKTY